MDISGYAFITGGASGIGKATAITFAREGARGVTIIDICTEEQLSAAKSEIEAAAIEKGFSALAIRVDVRDEKQVDDAVAASVKQFGRLDYAVNAAGIAFKHNGTAAAVTEDWKRVLDINLTGLFYCVRAEVRQMLSQERIRSKYNDQKELQRGSVVNIASICGHLAIKNSAAYVAAKHGVVGLTKNCSEDHCSEGIRVNAVCPGYIDTPMTRAPDPLIQAAMKVARETTPIGRFGQPQEIADACIFLCGGRSTYITGTSLFVDGGYSEK